MRRREFIAGLGGATVWPVGARAQQAMLPVVGFLSGTHPGAVGSSITALHQGLADEGYIENQNFVAEYRWAEDNYDRLPVFAADLVRRRVAVIAVMASTPGALAAKAATQTIPIVFLVGTDPVKVGLVPSLTQPGANLTGVTIIVTELMAKWLSLMHELLPAASPIAVLLNPANPIQTEAELRDAQSAAQTLGVRLLILNASTPSEIEMAFARIASERAGALVVSGENLFFVQRDQILMLAARYAVPAVYPYADLVTAGGLMSYGANTLDVWSVFGSYVGRVLKGENPAKLPVQRGTKIGLAVNLNAAKALGIAVPTSILLRADRVIE
jgi:putative tryptophan/tyrosine transport system substrate-binding protein